MKWSDKCARRAVANFDIHRTLQYHLLMVPDVDVIVRKEIVREHRRALARSRMWNRMAWALQHTCL